MKPLISTIRRAAVWVVRLSLLAGTLVVFAAGSASLARAVCGASPLLFSTSLFDAPSAFDLTSTLGGIAFGVASAVFLASILRRRFFCRYCCPIGTALDAAAVVRKFLIGLTFRILRRPPTSRAARLLASGVNLGTKFAFVGRTLAVAALLGAALGWRFGVGSIRATAPLALDPFSLLSRWTTDFSAFDATFWAFCVAFVVSVRFWRFNACPCGAFQDFAYFLPRQVVRVVRYLGRRDAKTPSDASASKSPERRRFLRDAFLKFAVVAFCVGALKKVGTFCADAFSDRFFPPNAAPDDGYLAKCARCGRCVAACPTKLLRFGPGDVPVATFENGAFCDRNCVACGAACPTGAIRPFRLAEKNTVKIATVEFNLERCLIYYQQECSICRRECPYEAIDFVWSEEEYASLPVVDAAKCVGCGRCVAFCPGEPIFAELDSNGAPVSPSNDDASNAPRPKALSLKKFDGDR